MTDEQTPHTPSDPQTQPASGWVVGSDGTWVPPGWSVQPAPVEPSAAPSAAGPTATSGRAASGSNSSEQTASYPSEDASETKGHGRRRRRHIVAAGVAGALLVAGLTTGLVVGAGGGQNASAAVIDAVDTTIADQTAQLTFSGTVSTAGSSIRESGSGPVDFGQNAFQLTGSMDVGGQHVPLQVRFIDGTEYVNAPGITQELPGKSWLSLDLSSLSGAPGAAGATGLSGNPAATLRILSQNGATVSELGSSTRNGVQVEGYAVTVSPAVLQADVAKATLPSWLRAAVKQVSYGELDAKVYVDGQGLLRSVSVTTQETVASAGTDTVAFSETFSGYGSTVADISAPPATEVATLQQVAQAQGQASAAAGSGATATAT